MRVHHTPIAGIAAALLVFAGCASAPAAPAPTTPAAATSPTASATAEVSEQSLLEACNAIGTTLNQVATSLDAATKTIGSNPAKAVTTFSSVTATLEADVAKITNPEVKAQGEKAVEAMKGVTAALDDMVKHPAKASMKKLAGPLDKLNKEFTAIATVCGG